MKYVRNQKAVSVAALLLTAALLMSSCTPSPVSSTPEPFAPPENALILDASSIGEYTVVYGEKAPPNLKNAITSFVSALSDGLGATVTAGTDAEIPDTAKEIVIGETNRPDSAQLTAAMRRGEFAVCLHGDDLYLAGDTAIALQEAMEYVQNELLYAQHKVLVIPPELEYHRSSYPLRSVSLNGVDITSYSVVIPEQADLLTEAAADNLITYFEQQLGRTLPLKRDSEAETEYEILIGDTNRDASAVSVTTGQNEYILLQSGSKIVCRGEGYMVGGGVGDIIRRLATDKIDVKAEINDLPTEAVAIPLVFSEAKSVILMIGDGMGFNAVEMYKSAKNAVFYAEYLPFQGNVITESQTTITSKGQTATDSAAAATALSSGYKTKNGRIGMDQDCKVYPNVREIAQQQGAKTAVLTTDVITGATPAAFLAHVTNRSNDTAIQRDIDALLNDRKIEVCKGDLDNTLYDATAHTLEKISSGNSSFFIMIEEAHIDKRSQENDAAGCISMVERFNKAIAYAIEFTVCHPDTLLIVTADHETGGIQKNEDGTFSYTTEGHTNVHVPIYAFGGGAAKLVPTSGEAIDNTDIAAFMFAVYGQTVSK